jgi:hypothetical protein
MVPEHSFFSKGVHFEECKTLKTPSFKMQNSTFLVFKSWLKKKKKQYQENNFRSKFQPASRKKGLERLKVQEENHFSFNTTELIAEGLESESGILWDCG